MESIDMKIYEKLGLTSVEVDHKSSLRSLELELLDRTESDFDAAWRRHNRPAQHSIVALHYYLQEEYTPARKHAKEVLMTTKEFLLGSWRQTFVTPEKIRDEAWWKRKFGWIEVFEACLLWGSALGEWEFLRKIGSFPEADSCISQGWKAQDRDLDVALGAFLRGAPPGELNPLLEQAASGSKKTCKCLVEVVRACVAKDAPAIGATLATYLKTYRKADFPQVDLTKKISIFGTLFVHWAEANTLRIQVPSEYDDHIVRLS